MEIYKRFVEKTGKSIGLYKSIGFVENIPYHFIKVDMKRSRKMNTVTIQFRSFRRFGILARRVTCLCF